MTEDIQAVVQDILSICRPRKIILYAEKRTMATGRLKSLSLCVIADADTDSRALRTRLHLAISVQVPVSLNVYTIAEWSALLDDPTSYAAWIDRKGQVVYEPEA